MAFLSQENSLKLENSKGSKALADVVKDLKHPAYVYDLEGILKRVDDYQKAFAGVTLHYALKSNHNPEILKALSARTGSSSLGVDVVSGGEIKHALECGFKPADIIFSGVGKSISEIELAVEQGIKQINVESPQELERIGEISKAKGKKTRVAWRMNPDVNPETHPYIRTGFRDNKFGMDESFIPELERILKANADSLELVGLTLHIGSQIFDIDCFIEAIQKTKVVYDSLKAKGYPMKTFDIGGGLGISYESGNPEDDLKQINAYGAAVRKVFEGFDGEVLCEPGRILTARFGVLLTQVQYIKKSPYKTFAIVDSGMHHLMRPCLYQAKHRIVAVDAGKDSEEALYDIVGPICESSDVLGYDRRLPKLEQGDWLAVCDAGAYGFVMANNYNMHAMALEIVL